MLTVAHHGSLNGTTDSLAHATSPKIVVVSVGEGIRPRRNEVSSDSFADSARIEK